MLIEGTTTMPAGILADFARELMSYWPMAGGAVVLVDREGVIAEFGFGHADVEHGISARPDHLFQIGSISKTFVSVAVNQLVDEGTMSLDEPITDILPWVDLGAGDGRVTVRQLLSHTGGLIMGGDGVPDDMPQLWGLRDLTRSAEPEQHFHYSNLGYMLLGQAVRARTGTPLSEVMRTRILEPLGMAATRGSIREEDRGRSATGYWPARDESPWFPGEPICPATWFEIDMADGNVTSNATDMGRFARFLLGNGTVDGASVISEQAMTRMGSATAPGGEDIVGLRGGLPVTLSRYGLGVNVETIDGHHCLTHGGGMVGFQTFLLVDRTAGVGVVVLTNANGCYPVAQVIARAGHQILCGGSISALPTGHDAIAINDVVNDHGDDWHGDFVAETPEGERAITITRDGVGVMHVQSDGVVGRLVPFLGRYVTDHQGLRDYRWDADFVDGEPRWICGPDVFRPAGSASLDLGDHDPAGDSLLGRYRSYSPWFTNFRVFRRTGRLFLSAPGGVEAPGEDCLLVPVDGGWRIGADAWLPERLVAGPIVNGLAISVIRDGVPYSRPEF